MGLPFLLAFPVLALLGVFGERRTEAQASGGMLAISVRYPAVFRYKMIEAIEVRVTNRGDTAIDTVTVAIDTAYAVRFSTVSAVPPFTGPFEVDLPQLAARETRHVRIEIQGEHYWSHSGELTVAARADTIRIPLRTTVYP